MINHVKFVLFEYPTFFMNMALDASIVTFSKSNLFLFIDAKTFVGVECYYMSLLEIIHSLIKFAQLHDVFICDFIITIKIWDVYHMYCDIHPSIHPSIESDVFTNFHALINYSYECFNFHYILCLF
jgi:hypothetical protein